MAYASLGLPVSHGFSNNETAFTYLISGTCTASDVGKAVALDTAAANTVKLAGDNDVIFGRLETFEDRTVLGIKVGAVARQFKQKLPKTAAAITVGQSVSGSATPGAVKAATAQDTNRNIVVEVFADSVSVEKF